MTLIISLSILMMLPKILNVLSSYDTNGNIVANEIKSWQTVISLLDRLSKARETLEKYADSSYWNNPLGFVVRENGNAKVGKELACDCLAEIGGKA